MITHLEEPHKINSLTIVNMQEKKMRIARIAIRLQAICEIVLIRDGSITQGRWFTVILTDLQVKMVGLHHHQQQVIPNSIWPALSVGYISLEAGILDRVTTSALKMTA